MGCIKCLHSVCDYEACGLLASEPERYREKMAHTSSSDDDGERTRAQCDLCFCLSMRSILRNHRFRRDARTLEDEEEMWFNTDEDDLEDGEAVVPPSDKMKTEEDLMEPISKFMERKKCESLECQPTSKV